MKTPCTWLVALSFFGLAIAGASAQSGADEKPAVAGKRVGRPDVVGIIKAVAADGKTATVAVPLAAGGEKTTDVKWTDKTRIVFTSVGPGEARMRKGYFIRVWLAKGTDTASRIHLASTTTAAGHAPSLAGLVTGAAADGKSFTVLLAEKTREEKEEQATLKITDKTEVTFTNIPAHGARVAKGMRSVVWLAEGSPDHAARVRFYGSAEKLARGKSPEPAYSGTVVSAPDGKSLILEVRARQEGGKPTRVPIKLGEKTEQVYHHVGRGGASPKTGYSATVWRGEGSADVVKKVLFVGPADSKQVLLLGKVIEVADDGKRFTLMLAPSTPGEKGLRMTIKVADKARVIFHGVGPDGARPMKGYGARVWLAEGTKDTATMVVFEGRAG